MTLSNAAQTTTEESKLEPIRFRLSPPRVIHNPFHKSTTIKSHTVLVEDMTDESGRKVQLVLNVSTSKSQRLGITTSFSVCKAGSGFETFIIFQDYMKSEATPCKRVTEKALQEAHQADIANHYATHLAAIVKQYNL